MNLSLRGFGAAHRASERRFWVRMGNDYGFVEGELNDQWLVRFFLPVSPQNPQLVEHSSWVDQAAFAKLSRIAPGQVPLRARMAFLDSNERRKQ